LSKSVGRPFRAAIQNVIIAASHMMFL